MNFHNLGVGAAAIVEFGVIFGGYFLPTIVAKLRRRPAGGIAVLNFFLGWTIIGWVAALAWAASGPAVGFTPAKAE